MLSRKGFLRAQHCFLFSACQQMGGSALTDVVPKWLLRQTEDQGVLVQALPGSLSCVLGQDALFSSRRA